MSKFAVVAFVVVLDLCGRAAAGEAEDKRIRSLVAKLSHPITEIDKGDLPLPFVLESLQEMVNKNETDPSKLMKIMLDVDGFNRATMGMFDPERKSIRFHFKLVGVRLDTVLGNICEQLEAVVLVRNEFVAIVPRGAALRELNFQIADDHPVPPIVYQFLTKTPLQKALKQLTEQTNVNIVLAPEVEAKSDVLITAKLVNVPIDAAVQVLADMAGLKAVRRANVFLITTKEQANEIEAELKKAKSPKKTDMLKLETPRKEKN